MSDQARQTETDPAELAMRLARLASSFKQFVRRVSVEFLEDGTPRITIDIKAP